MNLLRALRGVCHIGSVAEEQEESGKSKQGAKGLPFLEPTDEEDMEAPRQFCCPITSSLMRDPVAIPKTGHVFEREAIERWLKDGSTGKPRCPVTNVRLRSVRVRSHSRLRQRIQNWIADRRREKGQNIVNPGFDTSSTSIASSPWEHTGGAVDFSSRLRSDDTRVAADAARELMSLLGTPCQGDLQVVHGVSLDSIASSLTFAIANRDSSKLVQLLCSCVRRLCDTSVSAANLMAADGLVGSLKPNLRSESKPVVKDALSALTSLQRATGAVQGDEELLVMVQQLICFPYTRRRALCLAGTLVPETAVMEEVGLELVDTIMEAANDDRCMDKCLDALASLCHETNVGAPLVTFNGAVSLAEKGLDATEVRINSAACRLITAIAASPDHVAEALNAGDVSDKVVSLARSGNHDAHMALQSLEWAS